MYPIKPLWCRSETLRRLQALALLFGPASAQAQFITGTYDGDGNPNRAITQLGFQPDVVIIKGNSTDRAVLHSSTMMGDATKPLIGAVGLTSGLIKSLDSGGFTVGSDSRVNAMGTTYYFVAAKAVTNELTAGTYKGTGSARDVTVGFTNGDAPDYVIIMSTDAHMAVQRSSAMPSRTYAFDADAGDPSGITAFNTGPMPAPNGFSVGAINTVNQMGTTYHWIAWNQVSAKMKTDSYSGNGMDNRDITGLGFEPEYCIVRKDENESTNSRGGHKPASTGKTADSTLDFGLQAAEANRIQALDSDKFQVGSDDTVNQATKTYAYMCFVRNNAVSEARLRSFEASCDDRGVLLSWRTGYEVDNLGFRVLRERQGERAYVSRGLVAGSAFLAGTGRALEAGHSYRFWDPAGPSGCQARYWQYWIEDMALDGKHTIWGPQAPARRTGRIAHNILSPTLNDLGTRSHTLIETHPTRRSAAISAQSPRSWSLPSGNALKLLIRQTGWMRVPVESPTGQHLFVDGQEVPIQIHDGAIEFYGQAAQTNASDAHVYWLVEDSTAAPIVPIVPSGTRTTRAQHFGLTVERNDHSLYVASVHNGAEDNFFGPTVTTTPVTLSLPLHHVATSSATLEVSIWGVSTGGHRVAASLNDSPIGELVWSGATSKEATFAVDIQEGNNNLTLASLEGDIDVSVLDHLRIDYSHSYTADNNELRFSLAAGEAASVGGFDSPQVRVFDITYPLAVQELVPTVTDENGSYAVTVAPEIETHGIRELLAVANSAVVSPSEIIRNIPSDLRNTSGAELVIVAPSHFLHLLEPLVALRESQGISTLTVDIEDVYDEFSLGQKSPSALRDFLTYAYSHWAVPTRFALLVGDATFDPRNYLGFDQPDLIPTHLGETALLETAFDDWFGDFNQDGVPEVPVGRLPVRTQADVEAVIAKLVAYAEPTNNDDRHNQVLLVADYDPGFAFDQTQAELAALVPVPFIAQAIGTRAELLDAWNRAGLVSYFGHGSVEVWSAGLLTSEDAPLLQELAHPPFVAAMTCLNGFFHDLYTESLAETLLRTPTGGAIGVWSSSGLTEPTDQRVMSETFLTTLLDTTAPSVGEAVRAAKTATQSEDVRQTWVLLGDPTMRLGQARSKEDPLATVSGCGCQLGLTPSTRADKVVSMSPFAMFGGAVLAALFGGLLLLLRRAVWLAQAQRDCKNLLQQSRSETSALAREAELACKEALHQLDEAYEQERQRIDREIQQRRAALVESEQTLATREREFVERERTLVERRKPVEERERTTKGARQEVVATASQWATELDRAAGESRAEIRRAIGESLTEAARSQAQARLRNLEADEKEHLTRDSSRVMTTAAERVLSHYLTERSLNIVPVPPDALERITTTLRTLEDSTGVTLSVVEAGDAIRIESQDGIAREVVRRTFGRLIQSTDSQDIPRLVATFSADLEREIVELGKRAFSLLRLPPPHGEILQLVGKLNWRTSYTQNQWKHAIEAGWLAGMMACELGLDSQPARRGALLHDIGKSLTHAMDGSHAVIGADLARKLGESEIVANCIGAHHAEEPCNSPYAALVAAADAMSGGRPGARRQQEDSFGRRVDEMERIATSFRGVDHVHALHGGREMILHELQKRCG